MNALLYNSIYAMYALRVQKKYKKTGTREQKRFSP